MWRAARGDTAKVAASAVETGVHGFVGDRVLQAGRLWNIGAPTSWSTGTPKTAVDNSIGTGNKTGLGTAAPDNGGGSDGGTSATRATCGAEHSAAENTRSADGDSGSAALTGGDEGREATQQA